MSNTVTITFAGDSRSAENAFARVGKAARNMGGDLGSSLKNFEWDGPAKLAGGAVGAAMVPAIAAALAGGVVLALGGGVLALGIAGAAKDPRVTAAFGKVGDTAQKALKSFSAPFVAPLVRAAERFDKLLKDLGPTFDALGKTMAPVVDALAAGVDGFLRELIPAMADAAVEAKPAFEWLGRELPGIGKWLGSVIRGMAGVVAWVADHRDVFGPIIRSFVAGVDLIRLAWRALRAILQGIGAAVQWVARTWSAAWTWIQDKTAAVAGWLRQVPGRIVSAFAGVARSLSSPFVAAFNRIARAWNNTVGRLSFTFPQWIPGIGGRSISVPNLPTYHAGGVVPGVTGTAVPIMAMAGERVSGFNGGGSSREEWLRVDLGDLGDALLKPIAAAVSRRGGRVTHLGVQVVAGKVRT